MYSINLTYNSLIAGVQSLLFALRPPAEIEKQVCVKKRYILLQSRRSSLGTKKTPSPKAWGLFGVYHLGLWSKATAIA